MKLIVSSLVVVFAVALLIIVIPSSDAKTIKCKKLDGCKTQSDENEDKGKTLVDCGECAGWGCYYNNIFYYGSGCNGDDNICKIGNNQNVPEYDDEISFFLSCNTGDSNCAFEDVIMKKEALDPKQVTALSGGDCDPTHSRIENGPLMCAKQNTCERKSLQAGMLSVVHCEECAGWSCILNNTLYTGYGCKGDNNVCKFESNQNESEQFEDYQTSAGNLDQSWFVSCNNSNKCASVKLSEFMMKENGTFSKDAYNRTGQCNLKALRCAKANNCRTKKGVFGGELSHVECNECAAWSCVKSGVAYTGLGCKGDPNICQTENNQNGTEFHHRTNYFVACNDHMCAFPTILDLVLREGRENPWFADIECDPNMAVTKDGIFKCLALFSLVYFIVLGV